MVRFFDLSVTIREHPGDPHQTHFKRMSHQQGAAHVANDDFFKVSAADTPSTSHTLTADSFPDGEFLSYESVSTSVHSGTHLDAPFHYGSLCEGKPARTIEEIPLEWCYGPGVVLDVRHVPPAGVIRRADLVHALERARDHGEARIAPGTIVLLHTGCDKFLGTPAYYSQHPGVGVDALEWLVDQGVRIIGVDSFSFDRPFKAIAADYQKDGGQALLWPAHVFGRRREYLQIEGLANLHTLPRPAGFTLSCFPIKLDRAGAGWVRAVAIFND